MRQNLSFKRDSRVLVPNGRVRIGCNTVDPCNRCVCNVCAEGVTSPGGIRQEWVTSGLSTLGVFPGRGSSIYKGMII